MDFAQIIGLAAPLILSGVVQGLKRIMSINGYAALIVVFVIGGISALLGVGPTPDVGFVDKTVNAGWIVGVASLLYSIFKKRK